MRIIRSLIFFTIIVLSSSLISCNKNGNSKENEAPDDNTTLDGGTSSYCSYYFDACYLSYQMKMMKPSEEIFRKVLMSEKIFPCETLFVDDGPRNVAMASQLGINTFCPENGEDWTEKIYEYLNKK